jgi:hypothetical protein
MALLRAQFPDVAEVLVASAQDTGEVGEDRAAGA